LLRRYGCREIQGYLVARPAPPTDLAGFIETSKAAIDSDAPERLRALRLV
jgi:EAL domain-containing protein (putative c-di-GMP-specific phosphodiesterase class I)